MFKKKNVQFHLKSHFNKIMYIDKMWILIFFF